MQLTQNGFTMNDVPPLAFDHERILRFALTHMKQKFTLNQ